MPPSQQVVDSLWHCICPAFAKSFTAGPLQLSRARPRVQECLRIRPPIRAWVQQQSSLATTVVAHDDAHIPLKKFEHPGNDQRRAEQEAHRHRTFWKKLRKTDTGELYHTLAEVGTQGNFERTYELVKLLVEERGEKPDTRHYAALIASNMHTEHGSVLEVERLLQEMDQNGIRPDASVYESLLLVLAIHPSYTLRSAVLEAMAQQWLEPSSRAWHAVVCGQLRERQTELALDSLHRMQTLSHVQPQPWLFDLVIHVLADIREFDALLPILRARTSGHRGQPSRVLWAHVLSKATAVLHHPVAAFIWNEQVAPGYINPPTGLCSAVLDTAARAGDPELATDVFRILGNRSSPLTAFQYEALLEAHLASGQPDLLRVFSMLSVMAQSRRHPPTDATVRGLYLYLRSDPALPPRALATLDRLKKQNATIPVPILNAILEAALHGGDLEWALEAYRSMHVFSASGLESRATTHTFNVLLRGCYKAKRKDRAMFLAAEMVALRVPPDALTYDRLVLACLAAGEADGATPTTRVKVEEEEDVEPGQKDLDDAWSYLGEMQSRGWWPRLGTLVLLGKLAVRLGDRRVFDLMARMEEKGMRVDLIKKELEMNGSLGEVDAHG